MLIIEEFFLKKLEFHFITTMKQIIPDFSVLGKTQWPNLLPLPKITLEMGNFYFLSQIYRRAWVTDHNET